MSLSRYNPADFISWGALAEHLMSSELWLKIPTWLSLPVQHPQQEQHTLDCVENSEEEAVAPSLIVIASHLSVFEFSRWGEFCKAVSNVAWELGFIHKCKLSGDKDTGSLIYNE